MAVGMGIQACLRLNCNKNHYKLLANEWATKGICVNGIAPGYIATNNTTALREDKQRNFETLRRIPAGRWWLVSSLE